MMYSMFDFRCCPSIVHVTVLCVSCSPFGMRSEGDFSRWMNSMSTWTQVLFLFSILKITFNSFFAANREIAIRSIIEFCNQHSNRQFLFITPNKQQLVSLHRAKYTLLYHFSFQFSLDNLDLNLWITLIRYSLKRLSYLQECESC